VTAVISEFDEEGDESIDLGRHSTAGRERIDMMYLKLDVNIYSSG
jgi:hypothetical protein